MMRGLVYGLAMPCQISRVPYLTCLPCSTYYVEAEAKVSLMKLKLKSDAGQNLASNTYRHLWSVISSLTLTATAHPRLSATAVQVYSSNSPHLSLSHGS